MGEDGQPSGDITVWDEILFPFDPALAEAGELDQVVVQRSRPPPTNKSKSAYACDATGVVAVTIRNLTSNYGREYKLGRWSGKAPVARPASRKRTRKASN